MPISYPITPSADVLRAARFTLRLRRATAMSQSPFTGSQKVYAWPYAVWEADMEIAASLRNKGAAVEAFIASLRGRAGTFLMGPLHALAPRGTALTGGVTCNGATAAQATSLPLAGLGAGRTLLAGDYLQIGSGSTSRLHIVVEDATANGSGQANVSIEPGLRTAVANGDPVVLAAPKGVWRMNADAVGPQVVPGLIYESVQLPCVEAL